MLPVCPRCGFELQPIEGSPPPFCAHCGLPQLRVSPDAQAYASPQDAAVQTPHAETDPGARTDWPKALKLICVAALIGVIPPAALPGALSGGALGGPTLLLTPVLSLGVVSLYHRSRPRRHVHASIGARMGATLGLVMGGGVALLTGIAGFVMRYNYHSHAVDDAIQQGTNQLLTRLADAGPVPPEILGFVQSPQFRAGSFLLSHVLFALLLVFIGAVCGWIAGSMLNARRERSVGF